MEAPSLPMVMPTQPNPPRRPRSSDDAIRRAAAAKSVPALRKWIGDPEAAKYTDDELIDDLVDAMRAHDGYERARQMERNGYTPNADLVELLEGLNTWGEHRAAMADWVEANGIRPEFVPGQRVVWVPESKAGTVVSVDEKHGQYTVRLDEDGPAQGQLGRIGYIFDYEVVTAELWCCHIKGPDDVIACDDHLHAERLAKLINETSGKLAAEHEVMFEAAAAVWPHSAEAHLRALAEPSVDYAGALIATRVSLAMRDILLERRRQVVAEGWDTGHDDEHDTGRMLTAAVIYFHHATGWEGITYQENGVPTGWPWEKHWWKPKGPRRDLVRAGALCLAEQERLQRAGSPSGHVIQKLGLIVDALEAIDAGQPAAS